MEWTLYSQLFNFLFKEGVVSNSYLQVQGGEGEEATLSFFNWGHTKLVFHVRIIISQKKVFLGSEIDPIQLDVSVCHYVCKSVCHKVRVFRTKTLLIFRSYRSKKSNFCLMESLSTCLQNKLKSNEKSRISWKINSKN